MGYGKIFTKVELNHEWSMTRVSTTYLPLILLHSTLKFIDLVHFGRQNLTFNFCNVIVYSIQILQAVLETCDVISSYTQPFGSKYRDHKTSLKVEAFLEGDHPFSTDLMMTSSLKIC